MAQTAASSPLVRGVHLAARAPIRVRALRPFCVRGERVEPGTVLQVGADDAAVLLGNRQVEPAPEPVSEHAPDPAPAAAPSDPKPKATKS